MTFTIHVHHHIEAGSADRKLDQILAQQAEILRRLEHLMVDSTKVQVELDRLNTVTNEMATTIDDVVAADQAEDDAFRAEIQALKEQIANGDAVTQAQLDALAGDLTGRNDRLEQLSAALKAIGTNPSAPLPEPELPPSA